MAKVLMRTKGSVKNLCIYRDITINGGYLCGHPRRMGVNCRQGNFFEMDCPNVKALNLMRNKNYVRVSRPMAEEQSLKVVRHDGSQILKVDAAPPNLVSELNPLHNLNFTFVAPCYMQVDIHFKISCQDYMLRQGKEQMGIDQYGTPIKGKTFKEYSVTGYIPRTGSLSGIKFKLDRRGGLLTEQSSFKKFLRDNLAPTKDLAFRLFVAERLGIPSNKCHALLRDTSLSSSVKMVYLKDRSFPVPLFRKDENSYIQCEIDSATLVLPEFTFKTGVTFNSRKPNKRDRIIYLYLGTNGERLDFPVNPRGYASNKVFFQVSKNALTGKLEVMKVIISDGRLILERLSPKSQDLGG